MPSEIKSYQSDSLACIPTAYHKAWVCCSLRGQPHVLGCPYIDISACSYFQLGILFYITLLYALSLALGHLSLPRAYMLTLRAAEELHLDPS